MVHRIVAGYANTYLIENDRWLGVIDAGTPLAAQRVVQHILEGLGRNLLELRLVTATHFHIDHIGGMGRLLNMCPDAEVLLPSSVAGYLSGEVKIPIPPLRSWAGGLVPTVTRLHHHLPYLMQYLRSEKAGIPLPLLRNFTSLRYSARCELREGLPIPWFPGWKVIEMPGHTPDSIGFYRPEGHILISGDTILNMKGTGEVNRFCCDRRIIQESFTKLSALRVERLYPGHGTPIVGVENVLDRVVRWSSN